MSICLGFVKFLRQSELRKRKTIFAPFKINMLCTICNNSNYLYDIYQTLQLCDCN